MIRLVGVHSVKLLNLVVIKFTEFSFLHCFHNGIFNVNNASRLKSDSQLSVTSNIWDAQGLTAQRGRIIFLLPAASRLQSLAEALEPFPGP